MNNEKLTMIRFNKNGTIYALYKIKVQRGIKGNNKSKVDEILIWGIPKSGVEKWLSKNNLDPLKKYINTNTVINIINKNEYKTN